MKDEKLLLETFQDVLDHGKSLAISGEEHVKKMEDEKKELGKHLVDTSSIIAKAKNSVLQFPVYITTNGIRANEAHLISKLLERFYASYVQHVLSLHKIQSEEDLSNLAFLTKFHTNVMKESTIYHNEYYTPIDELDTIIGESVTNSIENGNITVNFEGVTIKDEYFLAENARLMNEPLTGFMFEAADDKNTGRKREAVKSQEQTTEKMVPDRVYNDKAIQSIVDDINSKRKPGASQLTVDEFKNKVVDSADGTAFVDKSGNKRLIYARKNRDNETELFTPSTKTRTKTLLKEMERREDKTPAAELLRDVEIKKINGLLPYGIRASFRIKGNATAPDLEYLIGIKTVLHPVNIKDLIEDIHDIITEDIQKLRKVKYKTGEISALDYFFNIKGLKADASKRLKSGTRWVSTLKRLGEYNKTHGGIHKDLIELIKGPVPLPNASLVISKSEVDLIKEKSNIDIEEVSKAKRLMKSLYLICLVIVDGSAGTMRVLTDSDTMWDTQSIAQLDADLSKLDNSAALKELGKVLYLPRR